MRVRVFNSESHRSRTLLSLISGIYIVTWFLDISDKKDEEDQAHRSPYSENKPRPITLQCARYPDAKLKRVRFSIVRQIS